MRKILTISLNPALDLAADVNEVVAELKLRCENPSLEPGGGGVNVSRAVALLGGDSAAFVALGGATGHMMAELLEEAGIDVLDFEGPGLTRQSTAITETSTGKQFRFGQPGPEWSEDDSQRALREINAQLVPDMLVVSSGSLPPGVAADFYVRLGQLVKAAGALMIVDTSGPALRAIVEQGKGLVHVLRMDRHESELLAGETLETGEAAADFGQSLVRQGLADMVILARGANGSVFATAAKRFRCVSPKGQVVSKVGAGDSFVGGFVLGLAQDLQLEAAGQLATAAAAAAVMTPGSQLCPRSIVDRLLPETIITAL